MYGSEEIETLSADSLMLLQFKKWRQTENVGR